jgi:hypothetical protein
MNSTYQMGIEKGYKMKESTGMKKDFNGLASKLYII